MADPDETVEELLARVEREHGPAIAAVVAKSVAEPPRPPRRNEWARRTSEGKRAPGTGRPLAGLARRRRRSGAW